RTIISQSRPVMVPPPNCAAPRRGGRVFMEFSIQELPRDCGAPWTSRPHRESVDNRVLVNLSGFEHDGWKTRLIGRIRKMLRLHAEGIAELIGPAAFARNRSV